MRTVFALILLCVAVAAQQPAPKPAETKSGPITMRGCINGGTQRYTFLQQGTGATFTLQGHPNQYNHFRGKTVELTGREFPPAAANGMNNLPELRPESVRVLADTCPIETPGRATTAAPLTPSHPEQAPASPATPRYGSAGAPNQTPPAVGNNPNQPGISGAPSPGTGNPPPPPPPQR